MSLLETEGWKVTSTLRCLCPRCGSEISSNAFSRSCHKKKCAGWQGKTRNKNIGYGVEVIEPWNKGRKDLLAPVRVADPVVLERVADRHAWTRFQIAGVNEWVRHLSCDDTATYIRLRVRRVGMNDSPRYTSYRGSKYLGEHGDVGKAMDAAERVKADA